jgi:hypothetical protein
MKGDGASMKGDGAGDSSSALGGNDEEEETLMGIWLSTKEGGNNKDVSPLEEVQPYARSFPFAHTLPVQPLQAMPPRTVGWICNFCTKRPQKRVLLMERSDFTSCKKRKILFRDCPSEFCLATTSMYGFGNTMSLGYCYLGRVRGYPGDIQIAGIQITNISL